MENVKVVVKGIGKLEVREGTTLEELSKQIYGDNYKKYFGAIIENEIESLNKKVSNGEEIKFIGIENKDGLKIYIRTLSAIYVKACRDLFLGCKVNIEHTLGEGLYTEIHKDKSINFKEIQMIKNRMNEIIKEDIPIIRKKITVKEAKEIFKRQNDDDKLRLLAHLDRDYFHVYELQGFYDNYYGYLAPSTGYVKLFDLKYYYPGVILLHPTSECPERIPEFNEPRQLARIFKETEDWADILDLAYVGSLNDKIVDGTIDEVIRVSEALHEKKIADMADKICEERNVDIILIAGPSSSGKTTFAQRLAVQLKVNGKRPISISMDDYFLDREKTPRDENGDYDFESVEAIDIDLFNNDLIRLLEGQEVELPKFNFISGKREASGNVVRVDENHPIIVEGIHALNGMLTPSIPEKNKYKVYVSALTQLNVDSHNRIPTTDTRMLRRIVRDKKHRGNSAEDTFMRWESVRKGEEKNIFPFQEEADIMFNTSLVYELSVLKKYVVPLLQTIDEGSQYYSEAKRLLKFLGYFKDVEDERIIPPNSILREFIGGSCFEKY